MSAFAQLTPGELFARDFRVLRPLAEGGMGAVYRVEQVSTGRERALKIMHPQFARDAATRERFTLEARVGSRIHSEHVVEVVSAGVDEGSGMPWLAMELLEGGELNQVVGTHGPLTPTETLEIFRQLAHGLGEAHRAGLVHRDIKPENLFLATSNRAGAEALIKILDFGVAKMVQEGQVADAGTRAVGTPKWMAPEQSEQGGSIVPATDVWPLGLLAFYLLTGRAYWRSASSAATSLTILMREMLIEPIGPPTTRARELESPIPLTPEFDAWFARCVVREPSERFPDASTAFEALEPVLVSLGAQPGPGALRRLAGGLRAPAPSTPSGFGTGPVRTPNPSVVRDSGDGATLYPPPAPSGTTPPVPVAPAILGGSRPPTPVAAPPVTAAPVPTSPSGPAPAPVSAEPKPFPVGLVLGGVGLVLVGVGAVVLLRPAAPPPAVVVPTQPVAPPRVVAPTEATYPAEVPFKIDSVPTGADVFEGDTQLGVTPFETVLNNPAALERQRLLTVKSAGFQPYLVHQGRSREAVHVVAYLVPEAPTKPVTPPPTEVHAAEPKQPHHPKANPDEAAHDPNPNPQQPQIRMTR